MKNFMTILFLMGVISRANATSYSKAAECISKDSEISFQIYADNNSNEGIELEEEVVTPVFIKLSGLGQEFLSDNGTVTLNKEPDDPQEDETVTLRLFNMQKPFLLPQINGKDIKIGTAPEIFVCRSQFHGSGLSD